MAQELFIFARFHAREGQEGALAAALCEVMIPTNQEPGCLGATSFRANADPACFYIHSRWRDEAAFEHHATLAHTVKFLDAVEELVDQPFEIVRTHRIAGAA